MMKITADEGMKWKWILNDLLIGCWRECGEGEGEGEGGRDDKSDVVIRVILVIDVESGKRWKERVL